MKSNHPVWDIGMPGQIPLKDFEGAKKQMRRPAAAIRGETGWPFTNDRPVGLCENCAGKG